MTSTFMIVACALVGTAGLVAWNTFNASTWHQPAPAMASFHDLTAETLEGEAYPFADLKGKRVMIVNTASRCGSPQYKPLEALHKRCEDKDLVILGFHATNLAAKSRERRLTSVNSARATTAWFP